MAQLHVIFAGPLVTFQDAGRAGNLRYGVPPSGPMDRVAFEAAQMALGNGPGGACIEVGDALPVWPWRRGGANRADAAR